MSPNGAMMALTPEEEHKNLRKAVVYSRIVMMLGIALALVVGTAAGLRMASHRSLSVAIAVGALVAVPAILCSFVIVRYLLLRSKDISQVIAVDIEMLRASRRRSLRWNRIVLVIGFVLFAIAGLFVGETLSERCAVFGAIVIGLWLVRSFRDVGE